MEKWKILWKPAKDCRWKPRMTHYLSNSRLAQHPQVRSSVPHQFRGYWVYALALCCKQPNSHIKTTASNLAARKDCSTGSTAYTCVKNLAPLKAGDAIRMKLAGEKKWSLCHSTRTLGRRSFEVEVEGRRFRRNFRQVRSALEPSPVPSNPIDERHQAEYDSKPRVLPDFLPEQTYTQTPEIEVNDAISPTQSGTNSAEPFSVPAQAFRERQTDRQREPEVPLPLEHWLAFSYCFSC